MDNSQLLFYTPSNKAVNLACGNNILPDFDNIDHVKVNDKVIQLNLLNDNWSNSLKKDYYRYILVSHFMEHIPHDISYGKDLIHIFMDNVLKIATDRCILNIIIPYPNCKTLTIANHCRLIDIDTFKQYTGNQFSNAETSINTKYGTLRLIQRKVYRKLPTIFRINDYHFRKYLNREIGYKKTLQLIYRINKRYDNI